MSMREDLAAALDSVDTDTEDTPQEVLEFNAPEEDKGETDGSEIKGAEKEAQADDTDPADESVAASGAKGDEKPDTRSLKAPVDWGPQDRQDWSRIPRNLQEKILKRESEMSTAMQSTSAARQTHDQFTQLSNNYSTVLNGMGGTPMETVKNLFDTVAGLRMGTQIQKAQVITDLINDFGIDINTLDTVLSGGGFQQQEQPQVQNQHFEQMLNDRLAPMNQFFAQQQQAVQTRAIDDVKAFSEKAEFLNDVRLDMADLIEFAAKKGNPLTMQQAYDKACALNPQVSQVMAGRAKQQQLMGTQQTLAQKRTASVSLSSNRGGSGVGTRASNSLRGDLMASIDSLQE